MTCVEIRERLGAFLDGEDPAPGEVDAHLRDCPSCSAALEELRAESAALDAALGPVAQRAEAAAERALASLDGGRRAGAPWWSLPLALAAGFLLALTVTRTRPEPVRPAVDPRAAAAAEEARRVASEVERILRTPEVGCDVEGPDRKLRKLGAAGVEPSAAWLAAADPEKDKFSRHVAARVVAELATREQAELLMVLIGDPDEQVRLFANKGLARLSGRTPFDENAIRADRLKARDAWRRVFPAGGSK
ncbi:MAG: zf-HC2 domain-containing protein [Planctomycetia bacterium]|nr:zf-HC2 domain-containing protein [Planctomycetia bacterium]